MEDKEGDEKFGCKTLPIVWGLMPTKVYISVWLTVVVVALTLIQLYVLPFGWGWSILYCIVTIILPLLIVLFKLPASFTSKDFSKLSLLIKLSMIFGILSMGFFYFLL
jgi:4-hydroxybenzoate polyprenyltransferase